MPTLTPTPIHTRARNSIMKEPFPLTVDNLSHQAGHARVSPMSGRIHKKRALLIFQSFLIRRKESRRPSPSPATTWSATVDCSTETGDGLFSFRPPCHNITTFCSSPIGTRYTSTSPATQTNMSCLLKQSSVFVVASRDSEGLSTAVIPMRSTISW